MPPVANEPEMARAPPGATDEGSPLARTLGQWLVGSPSAHTVLPMLTGGGAGGSTLDELKAAINYGDDEGVGAGSAFATTLASILAQQLNATRASTESSLLELTTAGASLQNISESDELKLLNFPSKREDLSTAIPLTLIFALLLLTGCIGNICTAIVIARPKNKYMHTATNYYLFSLAMSDFLFLILGLPQEMYTLWQRYPYAFGESFCIIRGYLSEASTYASILTISAFTVERYVAICHPLWAHTMSQLPRAITSIVIIWCLAAICAIPPAAELGIVTQLGPLSHRVLEQSAQCATKRTIYENMFVVSAIVFFIVPMIIVTVLYILIAIELRRSSRMNSNMSKHQQQPPPSSSLNNHNSTNTCGNLIAGHEAGHCCCQHLSYLKTCSKHPADIHQAARDQRTRSKGNGQAVSQQTRSASHLAIEEANSEEAKLLAGGHSEERPKLLLLPQPTMRATGTRPASALGAEETKQQQQAAGVGALRPKEADLSSSASSSSNVVVVGATGAGGRQSPLSYHESIIARQQQQLQQQQRRCQHQLSLSHLQAEPVGATAAGAPSASAYSLQRPATAAGNLQQFEHRPLASMLHHQARQLHSQQALASAAAAAHNHRHQKRSRATGSGGAASSKKSVIRMLGKYFPFGCLRIELFRSPAAPCFVLPSSQCYLY